MAPTLVTLIMTLAVAVAPLSPVARENELKKILEAEKGQSSITESTLAVIVDRADQEYTAMKLGGPATATMLHDWVNLIEYFERLRDALPGEQRILAEKEAGKVLYGYKPRWNGYRQAFTRSRLSPEGEIALLYQLSVHHGYMVLRGIPYSSANAADPLFWNLYGRLVRYTRKEGYMTLRDAQSRAELQAQAARNDRLQRGLRRHDQDVSAAMANAQAARWEFQRALEKYASGKPETGRTLLDNGVRSLMRAFQFGARPDDIQQVLAEFKDPFTSTALIHDGRSFRTLVGESLEYHLQRVSGRLAKDVTLPVLTAFYAADSSPAPVVKGETVQVEVIAQKQKINRDIYSLEQLKTFIKEISGEPVLDDYQGLVAMAAPTFHGMLFEIVGRKEYEHLFSLYQAEHGRLTEGVARRKFVLSGSAVLASAPIRRALTRSRKIVPVLAQLTSIDSHELWRKGGYLWAGSASELLAAASATNNRPEKLSLLLSSLARWSTANRWYVQAKDRFAGRQASSTLHLNIGACAENRYAISNVAMRLLMAQGLQGSAGMDTFLGQRAFDGEQETMIRRIFAPGYTDDLVALIERSYQEVIWRGRGAGHGFRPDSASLGNRKYAQFVTALARLGDFERQSRNKKFAERLAKEFERKPANGQQFYFRGVVRAEILHDEAGARKDYLRAQQLLAHDSDPEALLTLEKLENILRE